MITKKIVFMSKNFNRKDDRLAEEIKNGIPMLVIKYCEGKNMWLM
jgi:hypothetical protein